MNIKALNSESWGNLLHNATSNNQYIGINKKGQFTLIDKKNPPLNTKKISLVDIERISKKFKNENSPHILNIVDSLKVIASKSEAKHYRGFWKINKLFAALLNGIKFRGFKIIETKIKDLAENMLKSINSDLKQNLINTPVREYKKGQIKTADLIPTIKGEELGKGKSAVVFAHRNDPNLVVKKAYSSTQKDFEKEYDFASQLKHPNIVDTKGLFIKVYDNGTKKYKFLLEKIEGKEITNYYRSAPKLSNEIVLQLFADAKQVVRYLAQNNFYWGDVNNGNIFVTPDGHLKLCDFDYWGTEENSQQRSKTLLLGTMELLGWVIKSSNCRLRGTDRARENKILFPQEFFEEPCSEIQILSTVPNCYDNFAWMKSIIKKLAKMNEEQQIKYIENYVDAVQTKFQELIH
jgi:hypothetical protein